MCVSRPDHDGSVSLAEFHVACSTTPQIDYVQTSEAESDNDSNDDSELQEISIISGNECLDAYDEWDGAYAPWMYAMRKWRFYHAIHHHHVGTRSSVMKISQVTRSDIIRC